MEGGIEGFLDDGEVLRGPLPAPYPPRRSIILRGLSFAARTAILVLVLAVAFQALYSPNNVWRSRLQNVCRRVQEHEHQRRLSSPSSLSNLSLLSLGCRLGRKAFRSLSLRNCLVWGRGKGKRRAETAEEGDGRWKEGIGMGKETGKLLTPLTLSVLWMGPFVSGGGYCSEAISYATSLHSFGLLPGLAIAQHGDAFDARFWRGLDSRTKVMLQTLSSPKAFQLDNSIIVCHSEPGAWYPPLYETPSCPPLETLQPSAPTKKNHYVVGRTMFETDRVSPEHVKRCNRMDEIWVPTEFHMHTFAESGVEKSKLFKVVQAVDVWHVFNPSLTPDLPLPAAEDVFHQNRIPSCPNSKSPCSEKEAPKHHSPVKNAFVFLSIFKWETRKGWDILLKAYLEEFTAEDNVLLYLLTNAYHSDKRFKRKIEMWMAESGLVEPKLGWPRIQIRSNHVPQENLPSLYKAADAFVLPSRGEGWGRPCVEAMSMQLPVIATQWSGMLEYLNEGNGYPLKVEKLVTVEEGAFQGHMWAHPSLTHLKSLMRKVYEDPEGRLKKGETARRDMIEKYAPEVVAEVVLTHLVRIQEKMGQGSS